MKCDKCNKPVNNTYYIMSKGNVKKELDEEGYEQMMGSVISSSRFCNNCIPDSIIHDIENDNFEDCVNCKIYLNDDDLYFIIYKMKNNSIEKSTCYCETCIKEKMED